MSEEIINEAILTLDTLIDCTKEDGTYYNAQKEWEALEVFKQLQQENRQLKEDYSKLLETSKAYKKLLKTTMQKEHQAIKVLD